MTTWMTIILLGGTIGLVLISWRSLLAPRSHGFPRFFAFELLLFLIILNAPRWFDDPLCARQILSWFLLLLSVPMAAGGFLLLSRRGSPVESASGSNFGFENTTHLVRDGIYRYVRHPMYGSLLLLGGGAMLKDPSTLSVVLCIGVVVALAATARVEERENSARFGEEYRAYMQRTRMFIPFIA